ncbi:MAG: hypothetical protein Q4F88_05740 [Eubacteriales bacterium]|nr:hypothetical protein [Eubacteriales bacterium]
MIEKKENSNIKNNVSNYIKFGTEMSDGRMTKASDGRTFRLREAIMRSKFLGRELTSDEMIEFEC